MKLLLIDANEAFAHHLRGELLRSGAMLCDLELARSFAEAATQLRADRFDAILLDPNSLTDAPASLYGDLAQLAPRAPIMVLSKDGGDAAAIEAVRLGAHEYLSKNQTQPDWLLRRVRYAIDRRRGATARAQLAGPHSSQAANVAKAALSSTDGASLATVAEVAAATDTQGRIAANFVSTEAGASIELDVDAWSDQDMRSPAASDSPTDSDSPPGDGEWRVLHVENDPVFLALSSKLLRSDSPHPLHVSHAKSLAAASDKLAAESFDAVLFDLTLPDSSGLDSLSGILPLAGEAPVLVVTSEAEAATAIDGMRCGAEDFLSKTEPDMRFLRRATQLAIVRRDRDLRMPALPTAEETPQVVAQSATATATASVERRRHARYLLTKPIFATPVLPDGSPAATYSADGFSVDVSEGGLRFEIGNLQRLPTTHLLVGIEGLDTVLYFATVEARHVVPKGNGLDVGAQFAKGSRDLIRKENLEPMFNPATARYETGLPLEVIMKWVDFGIFRPALFDRTFVCPQCRAIPTFRNGCRVCGSVRLHSRPLIHHFACAHVGYVSDFEQNGGIVCPKCRTRNLIVGADFEHLNGPYHCLDCDWSDTELDTVGQCMKCELRFPMNQAIEEDLIGYHVNRLDPLAFINAG